MLQTIDDHKVFLVAFDTMPELPITWDRPEEKRYAQALHQAIQDETITEPGTYGIEIEEALWPHSFRYTIYTITE